MPRRKHLSASFVRAVKHPGRYGDGYGGHGLSLLVRPTKSDRLSKTWSQRIRIDGKPYNVGLGVYPVVTLAEARETALANRRAIAQGHDPRKSSEIPTLREACEKVIAQRAASWKKGSRQPRQWHQSFRDYAYPAIGDKPVGDVTSGDVMALLAPIWAAKPAAAHLVRTRIGVVMRWAIAQGYRADNPAGDAITAALAKNGAPRHFKAAAPAQVAGVLAAVDASTSQPAVKLAIRFAALTACRSAEVRDARWGEIDVGAKVWSIPKERMKGGAKPHRVPLSSAALAVLWEARGLHGDDLVFPGAGTGRRLNSSSLTYVVRQLKLPTTIHGLRSSFRNWCAEQAVDRQLAEACLAHTVGGVEGAYLRTDYLFERRREVMEAWGRYVAGI